MQPGRLKDHSHMTLKHRKQITKALMLDEIAAWGKNGISSSRSSQQSTLRDVRSVCK
jgi:hypothetical protein